MDASRFPFERLEQEKKRLESLRKYEPLVSDTDEDLDRLVRAAAYICDTPISLVNLIEANKTIFKAAVGTELKGSPREISFCSKAIQGSGLMEVNDALLDERFKTNPLVTGAEKLRFYAGAPLVNKEGMSMGTLCVFDQKPKTLLPGQREALETLGKMAVMIMEGKKQQLAQQKANLPAILALEAQVKEQQQKLQLVRRFLPAKTAAKYLDAGSQQLDADVKNMVLLTCSINRFSDVVSSAGPAKTFEILQAYYAMLADIFSTYNGVIYQLDAETVTAFFAEPLATFPYEETALYCAFDVVRQLEAGGVFGENLGGAPLTVVVSLHAGDVISGTADLPSGSEFVITGEVVKQAAYVAQNAVTSRNAVIATNAVFSHLSHLVTKKEEQVLPVSSRFAVPAVFEMAEKA